MKRWLVSIVKGYEEFLVTMAVVGYFGWIPTIYFAFGSVNVVGGLLIMPISAATWRILAYFIQGRPIIVALFCGAISPLIGCLVATVYGGIGLYWLLFLPVMAHIVVPIGIVAGGIAHVMLQRKKSAEIIRGFDVESREE